MHEYIPRTWRKPLYAIYALIGAVLGSIQVWFVSTDAGQPVWIVGALSVYAFVGTAFGFVAQANTPAKGDVIVPEDEVLGQ